MRGYCALETACTLAVCLPFASRLPNAPLESPAVWMLNGTLTVWVGTAGREPIMKAVRFKKKFGNSKPKASLCEKVRNLREFRDFQRNRFWRARALLTELLAKGKTKIGSSEWFETVRSPEVLRMSARNFQEEKFSPKSPKKLIWRISLCISKKTFVFSIS